jgi:hypothetical protein
VLDRYRSGALPTEHVFYATFIGDPTDEVKAQVELARAGNFNAWHVMALALKDLGETDPWRFGRLTLEQERAENEAATGAIRDGLAVLRESGVLGVLAKRDQVADRPGVDLASALLDAAVVRAQARE